MKKNVIILSIIILVLILVGVGVFIGKNSKNSNEIQNSNNYSEHTENIDDESSANEDTYNLDFLEKLSNFGESDLGELEGKVIDIKNACYGNLYACTSNKVYEYSYGKFEEVLKSTKNIKSMSWVGKYSIILQNSDNSYSMYIKDHESSSSLFKEFEGIEAENTIYAFDTNSNIMLIKNYDNSYYIDKYQLDDNKNIKSKELKIPVYLGLGGNNSEEVYNIKQIYVKGPGSLIFTLVDGKVYETGLGGIAVRGMDNGGIKLSMEYTGIEWLNDANKIYTDGDITLGISPLFEKIGDKNNIYIYDEEDSKSSKGTPSEQYKISIPLPNGYTTDDIKNILFKEDLLIEFNDNSIYIAEEGNLSKLLYNEDLSSLNKKGKIINICLRGSYYTILMDDKCLYNIDI